MSFVIALTNVLNTLCYKVPGFLQSKAKKGSRNIFPLLPRS